MSARHTGAGAMLAPFAAGIGGWQCLHEPLGPDGLGVVLLVAFPLAVIMPGVLVSLAATPMLLVPADWRKRYRKRRPRNEQKSSYIPRRLRSATLAADGHRCIFCGETYRLQIDHIFPWSLGGLTALWNLATLCGTCNRVKSNYWRFRKSGHDVYSPYEGSANKQMAAQILAHELRHRWSPVRWVRAGLDLAA